MSGMSSATEDKLATLAALTRPSHWVVRRGGVAPFLANAQVRFEVLSRVDHGGATSLSARPPVRVRVKAPGRALESRWLGRVDDVSGALLAQPEPPSSKQPSEPARPALRIRWRPDGHPLGVIDGEFVGREPGATGTWTGDPGGDR